MGQSLSIFARRFLSDETAARAELDSPLLVWEAPAPDEEEEEKLLLMTRAGPVVRRPLGGEPLVYAVKKGNNKANAFAMGVTVGRTDTNDVAIEDESVSRFHAWFAEGPQGWKLTDAESRNGTWAGALKLEPSKAVVLQSGARVRFGAVEMQFLLPDDFAEYLKALMHR